MENISIENENFFPGRDLEVSEEYKNEVALVFEAEFDVFLESKIKWGVDYNFTYGDFLYYYKPYIEKRIYEEIEDYENDESLGIYDSKIFGTPISMDELKNDVIGKIKGIPNFVVETPHFFQFQNPKGILITPENLNKGILLKIKETFNSEINPFLSNLTESLFFSDGEIYCLNLLAFRKNLDSKYGIMLETFSDNEKYKKGFYYFPFQKSFLIAVTDPATGKLKRCNKQDEYIEKCLSYVANPDEVLNENIKNPLKIEVIYL
jgi:hypothetical protein